MSEYQVIGAIIGAFVLAGVLSYVLTPAVKRFAYKIGAIDVPKDTRRMHKEPIPRLGGLAIFIGFLGAMLVFYRFDMQMLSILLGAMIIVVLGIFDDVLALGAKFKFLIQIIAAAVPVCVGGMKIEFFTSFNPFTTNPYFSLGVFAIPVTIIWIVGITNAVNLIDGLDGLAVGVSSIAALTMLAVGLLNYEAGVAIVMACLTGACLGFMPYNFNPAEIFMGDTGSLSLGSALACTSIMINTEVVSLIIGGLFIIETLSVMIQVVSFHFTGKRVFLMAPIHHHFEKKGWVETKVVIRFWIVSAAFGALGLALFFQLG